ncbi:MAG: HlyD family efflux transporter periplasmic adaptor subunit [Phycisphaerae bacterium]|nr:HlyD family efflux transporter periplasmic adaptor subunit [Phycisphaerae bacterium]
MKRPKITTSRQGRLSLHLVPALIWITAVAGVGALFVYRAERCEVVGLALGEVYNVAATSHGRVKTLPVKLFEHVKAGEVLVVINTVLDNEMLQSELEAEKATIELEIARLKAELNAAEESLRMQVAEHEQDHTEALRRMSVDVERARLAVLEIETVIEPDRIMLKDLELEVRIVKDLLAKEAVEAYELQKAETQYNFLARKIAENERLLAQAKKNAAEAAVRLAKLESKEALMPSLGLTLNPIRTAINVQYKKIDELLLEQMTQRVALPLMAPFDGVVSQILRRSGDTVLLGEPILSIARPTADSVMAWVKEEQAAQLREGRQVKIVRRGHGGQIAMSQITGVGPAFLPLPMELWFDPKVPEYGLPFEVAVPPGLKIRPNEKVGIKLL